MSLLNQRVGAELRLIAVERASIAQRASVMNAAYADYFVPVRVSQPQLETMDRVYEVDLSLSVMARTRWEAVGMALLSLRGDQGWISAVGVVPEHRRSGIARAMMERLIENARQAGAQTVTLEVISQNSVALHLYQQLGFETVRELLTWQRPAGADPLPVPPDPIAAADADELLAYFAPWHIHRPAWQRAESTLRKLRDRLTGYRLNWRGSPVSYCLVNAVDETVSILDVAADPNSGLMMPDRSLLQAVAALYPRRALSISNVAADDPVSRVLAALGFLVTIRQQEMALKL